jgi:hypothetical protein
VRLWVDGKLVIDQWTGSGGEKNGETALTAGVSVPVKLEYAHGSGSAAARLAWSSKSQSREVIPSSQLRWTPWRLTPPTPGVFDLLAGQPFNATVAHGMYGMSREPAADTETDYWDRWIVRTGKYSYLGARGASNDVSCYFNQNSEAIRTLSRDLGPPSDSTTQWTLATSVNYAGSSPNQSNAGGQYFDVLDDAGKVIARFLTQQVKFPDDYRITANSKDLFQGTGDQLRVATQQWQPLTITGTSKGIAFAYARLAPVLTPVFESGANWRRPKSLRLKFFCTTAPSGAAGRAIALRSATFSRLPVAATRR